MTRARKLFAAVLLAAVAAANVVTTAFAADATETYAYLPDHSVYFYDVAEGYAWAHREIDTLAGAGIIQGKGNHLFYPGDAISRADFIVMLDRTYGMSKAVENGVVAAQGTFADVPNGTYYSDAVAAAKAFGIATGTSGNLFQPKENITRQDAMVFLKRTLDCTAQPIQGGSLSGFSDAAQVKDYAREAVSALVGAGVVNGSENRLNPLANVTRAEIAVMLYRANRMDERTDGSIGYEGRGDLVNVCIGSQQYCDVIVENYDPAMHYGELMRYSGLRQQGGITYITLEYNQEIDRTVTYENGMFTFTNPDADGTVTIPAAADCAAIDVSGRYHQIAQPVSTGDTYNYCYPSVENGEVTVIYYTKA